MTKTSEIYERWYQSLIEKEYGHEVSQMIASLVAYQAGDVTISNGVKEKFMELNILDKDGKINIKNPRNRIEWVELAIRLQIHYVNNNYRF